MKLALVILLLTIASPLLACEALKALASGKVESSSQWTEAYLATLESLEADSLLSADRIKSILADPFREPEGLPAQYRMLWGELGRAFERVPVADRERVKGLLRQALAEKYEAHRAAEVQIAQAEANPVVIPEPFETFHVPQLVGGANLLSPDRRFVIWDHGIYDRVSQKSVPGSFAGDSLPLMQVFRGTRSAIAATGFPDGSEVWLLDPDDVTNRWVMLSPFSGRFDAALRLASPRRVTWRVRSTQDGAKTLVYAHSRLKPWYLLDRHASGSRGRHSFTLYETKTGEALRSWTSGEDFYDDPVALWPDASRAIISSSRGLLDWRLDQKKKPAPWKEAPLVSLAPSPVENVVGMLRPRAVDEFDLVRIDVNTGEELSVAPAGRNQGTFSPDGRWYVEARRDGKVWLHDIRTGGLRLLIDGDHKLARVGFSTDGQTLVFSHTRDGDRKVQLFDFAEILDTRGLLPW